MYEDHKCTLSWLLMPSPWWHSCASYNDWWMALEMGMEGASRRCQSESSLPYSCSPRRLSVFYIYLLIYHLSLYHLSVYTFSDLWSFPGGAVVKNPPVNSGDQEMRFYPWVRKIPWRRAWQPTPVFLPRKPHGQRSLVGYSPWGCKELDMTEWLSTQIPSGLRK